jgi:hypothetical protein
VTFDLALGIEIDEPVEQTLLYGAIIIGLRHD